MKTVDDEPGDEQWHSGWEQYKWAEKGAGKKVTEIIITWDNAVVYFQKESKKNRWEKKITDLQSKYEDVKTENCLRDHELCRKYQKTLQKQFNFTQIWQVIFIGKT